MYTHYSNSTDETRIPQPWAAREFEALEAWAPDDRERIAAMSIHDLREWAHSRNLDPSTGQNLWATDARGARRIIPRDPSASVVSETPWTAPLRARWAMGWATTPLGPSTLARTHLGKMIRRIERFNRETFYTDVHGRHHARLVTKAPRNITSDLSLKVYAQHIPGGIRENTRRPVAQRHVLAHPKSLDGLQKDRELEDELELARQQSRDYRRRSTDPARLSKATLLPPRNPDELISYLDSRGLSIKNENPGMALDELAKRLERIALDDAHHALTPDHRDIPSKTLADAERQARRAAEFVMARWNPQYLEDVKRRARKGGQVRTYTKEQYESVAHLSVRKAALVLGCDASTVQRYRRDQRALKGSRLSI